MLFIISPAKTMQTEPDFLAPQRLPLFEKEAFEIVDLLKKLSIEELQKLYKASSDITALNFERLKHFKPRSLNVLTPALLAYHGLQYQSMGARILTDADYEYLDEHLVILSAVYGALRPLDGVQPYRLEMGAALKTQAGDLYAHWRPKITTFLQERENALKAPGEERVIINLASAEYAKAADRKAFISWIDVNFFQKNAQGKLTQRAAWCKKARGAMIAFAAKGQLTKSDELKDFKGFDFCYEKSLSNEQCLSFVQKD